MSHYSSFIPSVVKRVNLTMLLWRKRFLAQLPWLGAMTLFSMSYVLPTISLADDVVIYALPEMVSVYSANPYVPDKLIIKLKNKPTESFSASNSGDSELDALMADFNVQNATPLFKDISQISGSSSNFQPPTYILDLSPGSDVEQAATKFSAASSIEYAEPDYIMWASSSPNDSSFNKQWGLNNTGQSGGKAGADIHAMKGWEISVGSSTQIVAVVDSGVNLSHDDLKSKVIKGYDFINNDNDPSDDNGHGSHVAGIAAASTNNYTGIAGVCQKCRVMPVKVLGQNGTGSSTAVAKGIRYAVDNGATVINLSLGTPQNSETIHDAVKHAHNAGIPVVAATGNDWESQIGYPARYSETIAVGSIDHKANRAMSSNYGSNIDLVAPGGFGPRTSHILSTYYPQKNAYAWMPGTSMATPHVAGAIGILQSLCPSAGPEKIRAILRNTTTDLGTSGFDNQFGAGLLNLEKALLSAVSRDISVTPTSRDFGKVTVGKSSQVQKFILKNQGSGCAGLKISSLVIAGVNSSEFRINSNNCPSTLAKEATCTFEVVFSPKSSGTKAAKVSITSDDPDTSTLDVPLKGNGEVPIIPNITVSPTSPYTYGNVNVGSVRNVAFTIKNTGNANLLLGNITVSSTEYVINSSCAGKTVAPNGSCSMTVTFKPRTVGAKNATLSISSNDPDTSILKVSLTGNGIAPNISINSSSRHFGNVNIGSNSAYAFTIRNTGNGALGIGKISSSNSEFSIYSDSCSNKTQIPFQACMVYVRFSPRTAGTRTATLTIPSNDPDTSALRVSLSGNGVASPNIVPSHRSFNFGNMNVGSMSGWQYFRIYNRGIGNLRIGRIILYGSDFIWTDYCSNRQIAPNSSCYVRVAFRPRTTGSKSAILSVPSNDPDTSTLKITFSGNGVGLPNMVINPTSYYFGNVNVGRSSSNRSFTISNTGKGDLRISRIRFSGSGFRIASNGCSYKTIAPSRSCKIQVNFSPSSSGSYSKNLYIYSNTNTRSIRLTGTGVRVPSEACSSKPTIWSVRSGSWYSKYTWNRRRVPNSSDVVLVRRGHNVTELTSTSVKGLCNHGYLRNKTGRNLSIYANSFISNYARITGMNGHRWGWFGKTGSHVKLGSRGHIINYRNASITAGNGGSSWYRGGDGGEVVMHGQYVINYGKICSGHGASRGGFGGNTSVVGKKYLINSGLICGGNGSYPGQARQVHVNGKYNRLGGGRLFAGYPRGWVKIDPNIISLAGVGTKVEGENITIFGGEDFILDLTDMEPGAISAEGNITLAVGSEGAIDLRGVTGDILKAGGELKILSDNILLDEGVELEDVIEATNITVEPAKILYEVSVNGSGTVNGKPGETLTLDITVTNSGPEVDTYTLKVVDAEGWNLGTLPETVTVEGLDSTDLELTVTLPSEYGVSDVITVTATSQADSTVEATTEMEVVVPYMVSGAVHNQNGSPIAGAVVEILGKTIEEEGETIEIEAISTFTDENGLFEIMGLSADNYTLKGSYKDVEGTPQDFTIEDQNVVINMILNTSEDGTEVTEDSKLEGVEDENTGDDSDDSEDTGDGNVDEDEDESTEIDTIDGYMVSGKILDNAGKPITTVTVKVGEQTTESNADGYWHISELKAGDYTATASKPPYQFMAQSFTVGNDKNATVTFKPIGDYSAHGTIVDQLGNPVAGATVTIGNINVMTNESGDWEIADLPEGEYTVTANKEGYPFAPANCAVGNNENCEATLVKAEEVLTVSMVANPRKPQQGENVTYTITVVNGGEKTATGVVLSDALPENVKLLSIEALDGGNCNAETVTCHLPDLTTGNSARVKLEISNSQGNRLENRAQVVSNEYPTDVDEKRTSVTPHLAVTMSCTPKQVALQSMLHCTAVVELSSLAPTAATGVKLVMTSPNNVESQSLGTDYGVCDTSGWPTVVCSLTDLSVESADAVSSITVEMENRVIDPGLLVLKHEAKVSANEYGVYKHRARNTIFVDDVKVDFAFVIDITGSMQEEIDSVLKALNEFIEEIKKSGRTSLVALVTFKDEDEVELQALTSDLEALSKVIGKLKASGGGTCNEASAEAISLVIPHVKEGGTILFATDASPYPGSDMDTLVQQLREKSIQFIPMITGDCTGKNDLNQSSQP